MMKGGYKQIPVVGGVTRFDKAPQSKVERSRMMEATHVLTAFNGGDIVPIKCLEVLPSDTYSVSVDSIIRQMTLKTPTMGEMLCDIYAFFVPNRVVNKSWKQVMGENTSGSWTAPSVSVAPLYIAENDVSIPVGSVADYYGLPTQAALPASVLQSMNDLPFRGYLAIYNEYFRDQNYQAPIPFSKANVYEGFLLPSGSQVGLGLSNSQSVSMGNTVSDGSFPRGSLMYEVYGEGVSSTDLLSNGLAAYIPPRKSSWSALDKPLKACKLHDALTSVLPSPQKGPQVTFSLGDSAPISGSVKSGTSVTINGSDTGGVKFSSLSGGLNGAASFAIGSPEASLQDSSGHTATSIIGVAGSGWELDGVVDLSSAGGISVDDLRLGLAMQQLYELYGRAGSRYREICHAMFGIEADDPYSDIPRMLGHLRFPLELYQTAQTSATANDSGDTTPQGNLAGFGYTNKGGFLFHETFLEHGFVHILAVVRQRNLYPSYMDPHWFRANNLDWYNPILANISEQPVMLRTINPFGNKPNETVFGYQEAWWEYRQHPDVVTGLMRSGSPEGVSFWTYQDLFNVKQSSADASFMESNAQEVLDETIAATSKVAPQFKALFTFTFDHEFPGPVYSVPGLDIV